ncbi:unnamed protein product [Spirodela intermedia]|uniref:Uncharacterized protein n=1 Tax=Spirodela intermedia TaxID=51605 RepID=A0ABN7E9H6_SPIIN|nr:unnamed protein product [Spirodela intermedia]
MIYSMDSRSFYRESPFLVCTTTPCPTAGWPPVTWKGSGTHVPLLSNGAHVPPSILSRLSPCLRLPPIALLTRLKARLANSQNGVVSRGSSRYGLMKVCVCHSPSMSLVAN